MILPSEDVLQNLSRHNAFGESNDCVTYTVGSAVICLRTSDGKFLDFWRTFIASYSMDFITSTSYGFVGRFSLEYTYISMFYQGTIMHCIR